MNEPKFTGDPNTDIPALIKWWGNRMTFSELVHHLPYLRGERALYFDDGPRERLIWNNVSQQCIDAITALLGSGRIIVEPVSELLYLNLGVVPVAKDKRGRNKWLPMAISLSAEHARAARR